MQDWTSVPYCGTPPQPTDLLLAWNLDPWLILALALAAMGRFHPALAGDNARRRCFDLALVVAALAFLSPLCALSSALFSVRIVHHVLLVSAIAPLLAAAFPAPSRPLAGARLVLGVLAASATLWFWHAPAAYAAALSDDHLYWLMELTLVGSAVFVWRELQSPGALMRTALGHVALIVSMGLLGALLTFAPAPLYALHIVAAPIYGLTPLEDQQLAGLVMWVPAIVPNLLAALLSLDRVVNAAEGGRLASPA
ncbi:cytochrome c oxidase assembly protein [Aureimonas pseudogalii]|uniref:Putative membrane protein n=1 Tax=Aureimonas pseudogalii TaxID=1744844 RepID=A0A7W6H3V2_9HYPH|nr:cytochrome c oxidase assembly protein [Aureimonas pseudogalii]MBB3997293.1 putative membrane protein [Aureimonas pseudogalii]